MTLLAPPNSKTSFTDLRDQFAALVSDPPLPSGEFGKLPAGPVHLRKRGTLHLSDSAKKTSLKTLS